MSELVGRLENQTAREYKRVAVQAIDGTNASLWVRPTGGAISVLASLSGTIASHDQPAVIEMPGNSGLGGVVRFLSITGAAPAGILYLCHEPIAAPGATAYATANPTLVTPLLPRESFELPPGAFRIVLVGSEDNAPYSVTYPRDAYYTKLTILAIPDMNTSVQFIHPVMGTITFVFDSSGSPPSDTTTVFYVDTSGLTAEDDVAIALSNKINEAFSTSLYVWSNYGAGGVDEAVMILSYDSRWIEGLALNNIFNSAAYGVAVSSSAVLSDTARSWPVNSLIGIKLTNVTTGLSGIVVSNTATAITATHNGAASGDPMSWHAGDSYAMPEYVQPNPYKTRRMTDPILSRSADLVLSQYDNVIA
jgi:hypothetical protein